MERKIMLQDITFVYTDNVDEKLVQMLAKRAVDKFANVREFFKEYACELKVNVCTKQELNKIVATNTTVYGDENNVPEWVVGFCVNQKVYIAMLTEKDIEYLSKVAVHELVHLLSDRIEHKEKRPKLLQEGLAVYLSGQMSSNRFKSIVKDYENNKLHKISEYLNCNGLEFANINGYNYSYFAMEYFLNKYGKEKVLYWLGHPGEFVNVINNLDDEFYKYIKWVIENR